MLVALLVLFAGWSCCQAQSQKTIPLTLSVPGPRNSVSIPLELAVRARLDSAEGIALRLRFVDGGGVAIQDLVTRNADFAVFGLPAAMHDNLREDRLVALAAIDDLPLYTLMVRADLRNQVRRIEDLKGRVIGVHSNSLTAKTTSHQVADLVFRRHGMLPENVRYVAAGQSWNTQSSAFISRSVDASMCDEPYGTRLAMEKHAFRLFSTGNADDIRDTPGSGFLRASLITRRVEVTQNPESARRMVSIVKRALAWIGSHSAEELADSLQMPADGERQSFLEVARSFPRQYSKDGRFSTRQLRETEAFFRASAPDLPGVRNYSVDSMIVDRWAGRKP